MASSKRKVICSVCKIEEEVDEDADGQRNPN